MTNRNVNLKRNETNKEIEDRIVQESYLMMKEQKSGCKCGLCATFWMNFQMELMQEIFEDMRGSKK